MLIYPPPHPSHILVTYVRFFLRFSAIISFFFASLFYWAPHWPPPDTVTSFGPFWPRPRPSMTSRWRVSANERRPPKPRPLSCCVSSDAECYTMIVIIVPSLN